MSEDFDNVPPEVAAAILRQADKMRTLQRRYYVGEKDLLGKTENEERKFDNLLEAAKAGRPIEIQETMF
jgi:hypothetical protein